MQNILIDTNTAEFIHIDLGRYTYPVPPTTDQFVCRLTVEYIYGALPYFLLQIVLLSVCLYPDSLTPAFVTCSINMGYLSHMVTYLMLVDVWRSGFRLPYRYSADF